MKNRGHVRLAMGKTERGEAMNHRLAALKIGAGLTKAGMLFEEHTSDRQDDPIRIVSEVWAVTLWKDGTMTFGLVGHYHPQKIGIERAVEWLTIPRAER